MSVPTFVARKTGSDYILVRIDRQNSLIRVGLAGAAAGLMTYAIRKRGMIALVMVAAAVVMLRKALRNEGLLEPPIGPSDSVDRVEEAGIESFPASDPRAA